MELTNENRGSDLYCAACISICDKSFSSFKSELDSSIRMQLDNVPYKEMVDNERYFLSGSNIELANLYRDFIFPFVTHHQYQLNNIYSSKLYLELALNGDSHSDLSGMDIYLYDCEWNSTDPDKDLPYWNWINDITILINCEVNEAIAAVTELLEVGLLELTIRKGFTYFIMVPQTVKRGHNYSPDRVRENNNTDGMWRG
ncbi:hypothetical protein [Paenibacillus sp. FSL R10-2788]|uniref:hypothetical protein n=1 Tax=Paenibacillus sp. FSL R10-2788 TaxID=2954694 RepID=UPI0030F75AD0